METLKIVIGFGIVLCLNSYLLTVYYREKIRDLELNIRVLKLEKHKYENKASYHKNKLGE